MLNKTKSVLYFEKIKNSEKIDTDKNNNVKKIAEEKLAELNRVTEEISLNILADHRAGKGVIIPINLAEYNLVDNFLILSANHKIYQNREEVALTLKRRQKEVT